MFTPIRKTKKKHKWNEVTFLSALEFEHGMADVETVRCVLTWIESAELGIWWGEGAIRGSFCPLIRHYSITHFPFGIWTTGHVEIGFQYMLSRPVFNLPTKRIELVEKLNAIDGVQLPTDSLQRRPKFPLAALNREASLRQFLTVWDWFVQEIRREHV
ncbi:MAG: hypothetical protein K8L91_09860 [Anaerolineae bacterium]|nr:hypothetical protein [Anaerolineae bacterium]